jgi:hypothetical protein
MHSTHTHTHIHIDISLSMEGETTKKKNSNYIQEMERRARWPRDGAEGGPSWPFLGPTLLLLTLTH